MRKHTAISHWAASVLALALTVVLAKADPIVTTTGEAVYSGQLMSGTNLNSGQTQGQNVKVYLENLNVTLGTDVSVGRIGPDFGGYSTPGDGGGLITAGTQFTEYLLHYDFPATTSSNNAVATVTFSTPIIGLIIKAGGLNNSQAALGVAGVAYENDPTYRGLDDSAANAGKGDDNFSVSADHLTFNIQGWTTTNVVDEVRIFVQASPVGVPDGGSTIVLLGLPLAAFGILRWRKTAVRA